MKLFDPQNLVAALVASSLVASVVEGQYLDRFNYDVTVTRPDGYTDYAPEDWKDIVCDESSREDLDKCIAYPDKWHTGRGWDIEKNYCRHCPFGSDTCGRHHMSPINLLRNRALGYWENDGVPGPDAHPDANECIDVHWMKYEDSTCQLHHLVDAEAFTIERFALRITQPITVHNDDTYTLECREEGVGRRFGRLDYSKGFSQWWFLSHIDLHTPSEHYQEGKRYDAEMQIHQFYSVDHTMAGTENELGTVTLFMQVYDDAPPYRYLDKLICLWRHQEYLTRQRCGMEPIETSYPGCFPYEQRYRRDKVRRNVRRTEEKKYGFQNVHDMILARDQTEQTHRNVTFPKLKMEEVNWDPPQMTNEEWEVFIEAESAKLKADDEMWKEITKEYNHTEEAAHDEYHSRHRKLVAGEELEWFNFFPMLGVRTEYYFRYSGSGTVPPCYGNHQGGTRAGTLHWRVMKDPIRIHARQLKEIHRLQRERIAPWDAPVNACEADTGAKVESDGSVNTARPLQEFHEVHYKVFCECKDWPSKWPEDRDWCQRNPISERLFNRPYNFEHDGF